MRWHPAAVWLFVENTLKKSPELKKFINRYRPWYSKILTKVTFNHVKHP